MCGWVPRPVQMNPAIPLTFVAPPCSEASAGIQQATTEGAGGKLYRDLAVDAGGLLVRPSESSIARERANGPRLSDQVLIIMLTVCLLRMRTTGGIISVGSPWMTQRWTGRSTPNPDRRCKPYSYNSALTQTRLAFHPKIG